MSGGKPKMRHQKFYKKYALYCVYIILFYFFFFTKSLDDLIRQVWAEFELYILETYLDYLDYIYNVLDYIYKCFHKTVY